LEGVTSKWSKAYEKYIIAAASLAATAGAPATAQQTGLVNVDVTNVLTNLDLDLLNNSLNNNTVQVPIGVAAAVCGIDANILAAQRKAGTLTKCMASNTTTALKQVIKKQAVPKTK
jgi:hypothetical protein